MVNLDPWLDVLRADGPLGTPPGDVASNPPGVELTFTLACAAVVPVGLVAMLVHWRRSRSPSACWCYPMFLYIRAAQRGAGGRTSRSCSPPRSPWSRRSS